MHWHCIVSWRLCVFDSCFYHEALCDICLMPRRCCSAGSWMFRDFNALCNEAVCQPGHTKHFSQQSLSENVGFCVCFSTTAVLVGRLLLNTTFTPLIFPSPCMSLILWGVDFENVSCEGFTFISFPLCTRLSTDFSICCVTAVGLLPSWW